MTPSRPYPRITDRHRRVFLEELEATCNVTASAEKAGHPRQSFYRLREQDAIFRAAWLEAEAAAVDRLVAEAFRIARDGVTEKTYAADGQLVSTRTREDTRLIQFLLAAHRGDVYSEKQRLEIAGTLDVEHAIAAGPIVSLDDVLAMRQKRLELEAGEILDVDDEEVVE